MRFLSLLMTAILMGVVMLSGCAQQAAPAPTSPAPAPTQSPAPAKATTATQPAATVAPTVAPKVDYPTKGKSINFIVNQNPGGPADVGFRILAEGMEKVLGVPVPVVNRPGATGQVGTTELVKSKPDGYTIGNTNLPSTITTYLDPNRQSVFGRKDLQPVANQVLDPEAIMVKAESPFKSVKDLVDAAKAKPGQVKVALTGIMGNDHLAALLLQKAANVEFNFVQFDGGAQAIPALLGDHVDAAILTAGNATTQFKSGAMRYLAVMEEQPNPTFPGVPTLTSQGYKVSFASARGVSVPAGTPKEFVTILSEAAKKAMEGEDAKAKMEGLGLPQKYMNPEQYAAYWNDVETATKPLLEQNLKEQKK